MGNVLCVDDEEHIRELFREELGTQGVNVMEAEDGHTAFEIFQKNDVDLVVTDLKMPNGDGIELVKNIRGSGSQTPIFLLTGFSDYTADELKEQGVNMVVFKPFDVDEVVMAILTEVKKVRG